MFGAPVPYRDLFLKPDLHQKLPFSFCWSQMFPNNRALGMCKYMYVTNHDVREWEASVTRTRLDVAIDRNDGHIREQDYAGFQGDMAFPPAALQHCSRITQGQKTMVDWCEQYKAITIKCGLHGHNSASDARAGVHMFTRTGVDRKRLPALPLLGHQNRGQRRKPHGNNPYQGLASQSKEEYRETYPLDLLYEIPGGGTACYVSDTFAANSELFQRTAPFTHIISCAPGHNKHASCLWSTHADRVCIERRVDFNALLEGKMGFLDAKELLFEPVVRFLMEKHRRGASAIDASAATMDQLLGSAGCDLDGVEKILYQIESILAHCKAGCNRSPCFWAVVFMMFFHETRLTARDAVDHLQRMRPLIEMTTFKNFECPLVWGLVGEPAENGERSRRSKRSQRNQPTSGASGARGADKPGGDSGDSRPSLASGDSRPSFASGASGMAGIN